MASRRTLLKAGALGVALLAVGSGSLVVGWSSEARPTEGLQKADRALLAALLPVMVGPNLPGGPGQKAAIEAGLARSEAAFAGLAPAAQGEFSNLLAILGSWPGRTLLAGVRHPWHQATPDELEQFLARWRGSRFTTLRAGYQALHDLILGPWYSDASTWGALDYPGPATVLS